jgi:acyl-CoA thioester hydrolase
MRPQIPTLSQIDELPALLRTRIPPEWQDSNGHLNIRYYMRLYDEVGAPLFETFGIDAQRTRQSRWGLFDLEHHLWYLREIHVGDEVTIHCRLLARTVKRFHGTLLLVNRTRGQLASAMEFLSTCADLDARATAALPPDVAACMDVLIERHHKLSWPVPVSGVMAP